MIRDHWNYMNLLHHWLVLIYFPSSTFTLCVTLCIWDRNEPWLSYHSLIWKCFWLTTEPCKAQTYCLWLEKKTVSYFFFFLGLCCFTETLPASNGSLWNQTPRCFWNSPMNELLYSLEFRPQISAVVWAWKLIMSPVSLALACMLVIGAGEGWGQREVYSCLTDEGLEAAPSDSVRNLFTCGGATNNCRVYIGQKKTTSPPGSHTT